MKGTVKWYNTQKGYGFLQPNDDNENRGDIFIHRSDIPEGIKLYDNDKVEFDIEETDRGLQAKNLKKL